MSWESSRRQRHQATIPESASCDPGPGTRADFSVFDGVVIWGNESQPRMFACDADWGLVRILSSKDREQQQE